MRRSSSAFIPDRGDYIWITLNPIRGHEQSGRRPALVLSPKSYNRKTGLCILCPATRSAKGYAFEVAHTTPDGAAGVVLSDHIRCVDWQSRQAELIHRVPAAVLGEVVSKLEALIISPEE